MSKIKCKDCDNVRDDAIQTHHGDWIYPSYCYKDYHVVDPDVEKDCPDFKKKGD